MTTDLPFRKSKERGMKSFAFFFFIYEDVEVVRVGSTTE
jgi:hypothetical protein